MSALDQGVGHLADRKEGRDVRVSGFLEVRGKVTNATRSLIPNISIYSVDCGDVKLKFDVHSKLVRLRPGDEIVITISKETPTYERGTDFVAWGYVISIKHGESLFKMVVSLWGYIVIVETGRQELLSGFNFMDRVYFRVSKLGTSTGT